jgi:8-oxo-dGTP pyrophosphatase MutT (NUDIX family)
MFQTNNKFKQVSTCINCGGYGHTFRGCLAPITSFGIILFRVKDGWEQAKELTENPTSISGLENVSKKIEFLLIQRKDSLGFVELMRGKYRIEDLPYIKVQLAGLTNSEKERILHEPFDTLWQNLWGYDPNAPSHAYKNEKEIARGKLEQLRTGYTLPDGTLISLEKLFQDIPKQWVTPEWGFPKGRRDGKETELRCALRELYEETSIEEKDIHFIRNLLPLQETFFGTNHVHYCHKYFVGYMPETKDIAIDTNNHHMVREIGNIGWFSLNDALEKIRPDNVEKREILLKVSSLLRNYCPLYIG